MDKEEVEKEAALDLVRNYIKQQKIQRMMLKNVGPFIPNGQPSDTSPDGDGWGEQRSGECGEEKQVILCPMEFEDANGPGTSLKF